MDGPVLIKGAGELATGVAWRLHRSGFPVIMTEIAKPLAIRRSVSFCEAVPLGTASVEGVTARRVATAHSVLAVLAAGEIPVLVDPCADSRKVLCPWAIIDATMTKRDAECTLADAPVVVGLGPGFAAGANCHAVIETQRGHNLGRVYYRGSAAPDTGIPAERAGHSHDRVLRATIGGRFLPVREIGDLVKTGDVVAHIESPAPVPVMSAIDGILRGILRGGTPVVAGMKVADVDPVAERERCFTISDKALAVAGGVLEALMVLR